MCGLIWFVQVVHYPGFSFVARESFPSFHNFHSTRITWIVGPVMTVELVTAAILCLRQPDDWLWWANLGGVIALWLCTALLSVPNHNQLALGYSEPLILALVATNWPRTLIWSLRSLLLTGIVARSAV